MDSRLKCDSLDWGQGAHAGTFYANAKVGQNGYPFFLVMVIVMVSVRMVMVVVMIKVSAAMMIVFILPICGFCPRAL